MKTIKLIWCFLIFSLVYYQTEAVCNRLSLIKRIQNCQNLSSCSRCNCCTWSAWRACVRNNDCSQSIKNECTTVLNTVVANPRCKNSCSSNC
ncbi:hypothetical protein C1646_720989 [Rhizophagus diaphanus]|nr:hypothetical protein C1646_720989 [Rhizophagus diaphanus] [Rhizophagus sp. MUCL 43196]